jgi:hypothetical protein
MIFNQPQDANKLDKDNPEERKSMIRNLSSLKIKLENLKKSNK